MRVRRLVRAALLLLLVAGCAGDDTVDVGAGVSTTPATASSQEPVYRGTGAILEDDAGPVRFCQSLEQSNPPQCQGVELTGWDWSMVDDETAYGGTTYGTYEIDVTRQGARLEVARAGPPGSSQTSDPLPDFSTPCPTPVGGWGATVDPSKLAFEHFTAFHDYINRQPDRSATWVDNSTDPAFDADDLASYVSDEAAVVTNLRFTHESERHEAEIRQIWGGPVCVTEGGRAHAELLAILEQVSDELDDVGSSGLDEVAGTVYISVLIADPAEQADLDRRYGAGTVVLHPALLPVDVER